jgi:ATP/maltotriose-dependent transcriptional regulator MalT
LRGWSLAQLTESSSGGWDDGVAQIRESLDAHRGAGARTFGSVARALLAEIYMLRGRFEEAAAALSEGLDLAREADEGVWVAELHRLRGELFSAQGAKGEAETQFERERLLELRALSSLFRIVRGRTGSDRTTEVRSQLANTYAWFTEGFDTADLREAQSLLAGESGT